VTGPDRVVVEADGGARGNPGPAGYGAVVRDAESGEVLAERSEFLGTATNNVAEYSGLIAGLAVAAELGARVVDVRMDSKLVIEQMSGRWQIKHPGLRPLAAQAAALVRQFDTVRFGWIPRERNRHADALANKAMDEGGGAVPKAAAREAAPKAVAAPAPKKTWEQPIGTPTRLVLLRHGETELTATKRYSGRGDVPLSERGAEQVRAVADRVARVAPEVAAVVSSPLSRCLTSAAILADALAGVEGGHPPVVVDDDLVECDFGAWEGLTFAEVREKWPAELERWLASPAQAPPDGESFRAVTLRVRRAVARLREGYPARNVVVMSHVGPVKLLLRDALAAGDAFLHRLYLEPGGLSIVDFWPDGGVAVRVVNETAHLS
jgi:ribonuclease H / adenosylcobalamin/alpha-ribazole phosphatase